MINPTLSSPTVRSPYARAITRPSAETLEPRQLLAGEPLPPPRFLLGDTDPAPVFGAETGQQLAAGNGVFLSVWVDQRSKIGTERQAPLNYGWPGAGTDADIFGVLLDSAGRPIGNSFSIYMGARAESLPHVAFNGTDFVVSWQSVPGDDQYGKQVMAARVSPSGVVLDPAPIVLDTASQTHQLTPTGGVVSDAQGNTLVAWGGWSETGAYILMGRRISPAGVVLDAAPRIFHTGSNYLGDLFYVGGTFGFTTAPDAGVMKLSRIDATTLNPLSTLTLPKAGRVASNGSALYLAWGDYITGVTFGAFGSRLALNGALLDGPAGRALTAEGPYANEPVPTWDGTNWSVATMADGVFATRVSPGGVVLNPGGTLMAADRDDLYELAPAGMGDGLVVAFSDRELGGQDVSTIGLSAGGQVSGKAVVSLAARDQMNADIVAGPGGFLAVYKDMESGAYRALAQRLDSAGQPIDSEPLVLSSQASYLTSPQVAFNGQVYTVVWYQYAQGVSAAGTYFRRLDAQGQPIDPAPVFLAAEHSPDIAAAGDQFLVASHYNYYSYYGATTWRRLNSAGQVLASAAITGKYGPVLKHLDVIGVGDRWAVLTQDHGSYTSQYSGLALTWIDRAGQQGTPLNVGNVVSYAPHLATSGNNLLMVYDQKTDGSYQDVWGRIIGLDHSISEPFKIGVQGTANSSQSEAHVTWNGREYVAVWVDHRNRQYPLQPEGDIYAARISEAGAVLDPEGVPVAATGAPDDAPNVSFGHGITLLSYSTFNPAVTAGSMRIAVRDIFSPLRLEAGAYRFETDPGIELDFTADVSATLTPEDLVLRDVLTGQSVDPALLRLSFDTWRDAARVRYAPGPEATTALPDGNYRVTVPAGSVISVTGQTLPSDVTLDFFVLSGDADRDRRVDLADFGVLAARFNQPGTFSQGDFDYSGTTDVADFAILASKFNTALGAAPLGAAPIGLPARTAPAIGAGWTPLSLDELAGPTGVA